MDDAPLVPARDSGQAGLQDLVMQLRQQVEQLRQEAVQSRQEAVQSCQEAEQLRQENASLCRENLELRQQAGYWKSTYTRLKQREDDWKVEVDRLQGENRQLQGQLFGRKSEKSSSSDRTNHLDGEEQQEEHSPKRKRGQQKDRPAPKRRDYTHLPVREELHELPLEQRLCPQCGEAMTPSNTEDSEQIEIEVKAYRRRIRRRRYQRTCSCSGCARTVIAPAPPKLIPKARLGLSTWVEILLDKFASHRPTERLLSYWQLLELGVASGTVTDGLKHLEPLFTPLYQALLDRNGQSAFVQADETRWMVFIVQNGKTGHCWWMWVFVSNDTVVFRLDPHRSHDVPEGHFAEDARVVMMVDRYSAYKAMAQVKLGNIVLAFCWAHVRRDFVKVGKAWPHLKEWALVWLRHIRDLYRQQRQRLTYPAGSPEFAAADATLRQRIATMQTQAATELADPRLHVSCRKVLTSLQEHWTGLTRFVDDLRIPLDNNASERKQRGPAVGRKNYYGSGALWSGRLAAMLFSLFATLGQANVNVRKWLTWYLQSCAEAGGKAPDDVTGFLPWNLSAERRQEMVSEPTVSEPDDSS
jgi:transposase